MEDELRQLVRRHGITNSVVFRGQLSRREVVNELCRSDIFLLPSIDEGFGTVLLEAQSAELPVVATKTGGIPEAVDDDASILVQPRDSVALANKLVSLIQDPLQREAMGKVGRQFVVENYSIKAANDLLESRFKHILNIDEIHSNNNGRLFPS